MLSNNMLSMSFPMFLLVDGKKFFFVKELTTYLPMEEEKKEKK